MTERLQKMTTARIPPEALRASMVRHIVDAGYARSDRVRAAMRKEPRHRYVPAASVVDAYSATTVIIKRASNGTALSFASEPVAVAMQLDQLDVRPGDYILEVGTGSGYTAALLAQLTGPTGQVTTVDIDPVVTAQARGALEANGHRAVRVLTRDGVLGVEERAPFDRIIFTLGAWDLPPAVWNQLAPGGRLVVPLRWRGQTRSVAFEREGARLRSFAAELCDFVPMTGHDQDGQRTGYLDTDGHVGLCWDADQPIDPTALRGVLAQRKTAVWSGATVGINDPFDGVWLRLTGTEPGTCRVTADVSAVQTGLCIPAVPSQSPALVEDASLAYFTQRHRGGDERRWELGAIGQGPAGPQLADCLCEQIRAWDRDRAAQPVITVYPADTPDRDLPNGLVINKPKTRVVISY